MLKLSKKTDYALIAMHYIAMENDQVVNTKAIAEKYHIPLELLAKILQKLAKKGLVISHNGPKGGYLLAKDPADISIGEVIEAIEGPIGIAECYHDENNFCSQKAHCNIRTPMGVIQIKIIDLLKGISLEQMHQETINRENLPVHAQLQNILIQ
ncbi:MAG: Rrf2 family transcriptional regulator [Nitrospirae bacterium]|nr:Rrf2 family transcriptional regulator [Nitrospirota bacterium]MBI3595244.1 Rrf2 family transcriptional regulator [Nitrospirota bacterium]